MYLQVICNVGALFGRGLTYRGEAELGSLVKVEVGGRKATAIVIGHSAQTELDPGTVKEIHGSLYAGYPWLSRDLLDLAQVIADYYLCSLGAVLSLMLPVPFASKEVGGLKRPPKEEPEELATHLIRQPPVELTEDQALAIQAIKAALDGAETKPYLLHGVTGSGKTEVYLRALSLVIAKGKQVIYLVPEISLTPQAIAAVVSRFGNKVAVVHSSRSPGERARTWQNIAQGKVEIVVGARSAVFAPVPNLGLIIIDEEHEASYRHEGGLNFHARVVAQLRVRRAGGFLLLGSATPSLEVYASALRGQTTLLNLPSRPGGSLLPEVKIVDMREELRSGIKGLISAPLRLMMAERLAHGEQALLLFNRRGYAQLSLCHDCGHIPTCPHCDVSLRLHHGSSILKCHYCGFTKGNEPSCPKCGGRNMHSRGAGTEKLEQEVGELFPDYRITRLDRDTTSKKGSHQRLLTEFGSHSSQILLGTRMIAKGLDFPSVTVVGVIDADSGLFFPDFRAVEDSFHLLMQVAGRSGRGQHKGMVFIQAFNPDHYCLRFAREHDFLSFFKLESKLRRKLSYPPYGGLATLCFRSRDLLKMREATTQVAKLLAQDPHLTILGPVAESPEKVRDVYRHQIGVKGRSRKFLQEILRKKKAEIEVLCSTLAHWYIIIN
ncbi:MAG: primosomal protein N' [Peptococcaceae bacterium]|nr:primosomal protein N' [Peptococcaceae bacterium]